MDSSRNRIESFETYRTTAVLVYINSSAAVLFPLSLRFCDFRYDGIDKPDEVLRSDLYLKVPHSGADINVLVVNGCAVEICREAFLHTYRGTAAADVARYGQQSLHR